MSEELELTDTDWRTLCDTLRGSIAMFDMLLRRVRQQQRDGARGG